jgi:hypothetical protein
MVLHLGHFVHRPSGISRFFDLPPSFGFLAKVVFPVGGGGVTAGSVVSRVSGFFVNEVVLIMTDTQYSSSAGNCPDANFARASPPKHLCTGAGGCASGKNVVNQDYSLTVQGLARAHRKSTAHVGQALGPAEESLGLGRQNAPKKALFNRNARSSAQATGDAFGLVEFTFAQFSVVEWNRDDNVPFSCRQSRDGAAEE